jgi:NTP pyrophosphatase (non-canonical NTP hydrolase)
MAKVTKSLHPEEQFMPDNADYAETGAPSDAATTVGELRAQVAAFVAARDWNHFHSPKNLAMSIAIEAAEIMEHFQWYTAEESTARMADPAMRAAMADEVADVLIYCLSLANSTGMDVTQAIRTKMARNEGRFPVDKVRGRLGRDDDPSD